MAEQDWSLQPSFACAGEPWRVRTLTLDERIGEPFSATLRVVTDASVAPLAMLGQRGVLTMRQGEAERLVSGIVTRVEPLGSSSGLTHARIRLEPRVVLGRRRRRYCIFQEMSVPDIVAEVLRPITGLTVKAQLQREYPAREYCVQHGEHDLAFVSRLLEDEGISWLVVDDGDEGEQLLMFDTVEDFPAIDPELPIEMVAGLRGARPPGITGLMFAHRLASPGIVERDWNWIAEPPNVRESLLVVGDQPPTWEVHDLRLDAHEDGERHARDEYELHATRDHVGRGDADVIGFGAGRRFELETTSGDTVAMLLLGVRHQADIPGADTVASANVRSGPSYTNAFECVPLERGFRPARVTERPRVHGLHTAIVTGPDGEEIYTDAHGRIRVRMHWDRSNSAPELSSCWLRVAQSWGGAGWGTVFIPRVGMEVLVAFIDGDPDRPMCIGSVYNGANHPPYTLPDDRTKTTIRTQSSPGGKGHNELTFEDSAGHEEVYLRAQRNLREVVLANHSERVGVDDTANIGRDRKTTIDRHESHAVKGDRFREVGGSEAVHVSGSQHVVVFGGPGSDSGGPEPTPPGADMFVHGSYTLDVRDQITLRCGPSTITMSPLGITVVGPMIALDGGGSAFGLVPGAATMSSDAVGVSTSGGSEMHMSDGVRVSSGASVKLQVDDSRLTLDGTARLRGPTTLVEGTSSLELISDTTASLKAPSVELTADESITVTSEATLELSGATITSKASGPHTIKGLPVHLNPPGA